MSEPAIRSFTPHGAQPIESMIADAKGVLEGLFAKPLDTKDLPAHARAQIEASQRVKATAARFFSTAEGREFFEALCDATVRRPVVLVAPQMNADAALLYAAKREGQNEAVYMLLAMIAEGLGQQPIAREGA